MLNVTLICVDKLREKYLKEAASEYEKRLSAYCRFKTVEVNDDAGLIANLPPRAYKIALCIEGKEISSEMFAEKLLKLQVDGVSEIVFLIGGADGMSDRAKNMCDFRLSFSPMTFPHPLMRVILLEQLYRALNINAGGSYHH